VEALAVFRTDADKLLYLLETEAELCAFLADETLETEAGEERPKYITNYIGSKQKLTDWIWKSTPDDVQTAVDAFSGSAVVAYMYKTHGLGVYAIDRLAYCHHIARAIVENDSTTLSDEEIEGLLADNPKARDFVRKHFKGIYFEPGVHAVIDTIRSNIDSTGLGGYKRDIALFALGKACITGKGGFGHFGTTKKQEGRADNPKGFKERFAANCRRINALVFKGERPCKAHQGDTRKILPGLKADAAYFDPPYATQFSQTNYERAYHFVEGLMTWWDGKEIQAGSQTRQYEIPTEVTRSNASQFFQEFLGAAKHIKHWIISYRDQAFPSEKEIKKIVAAAGKASRMKTREHQYSISAKHGENSTAKEHLFVCTPAKSGASSREHSEKGLVVLADFGAAVDDSLRASAESRSSATFLIASSAFLFLTSSTSMKGRISSPNPCASSTISRFAMAASNPNCSARIVRHRMEPNGVHRAMYSLSSKCSMTSSTFTSSRSLQNSRFSISIPLIFLFLLPHLAVFSYSSSTMLRHTPMTLPWMWT